jgi:hypothetical protein
MAHTINPEVVTVPVPGQANASYELTLFPQRGAEALNVTAKRNGRNDIIGVLHPVAGDQYVAEVLQQRSAPTSRDEALKLIVKFVTSFG